MNNATSDKVSNASTDVKAEIARIFDEARDRALALVTAGVSSVPDVNIVASAEQPDWRKLKDAARICGVHPDTMARQARANGLGSRIDGGAWRIDMTRVRAWQEVRPYARLPQAMSEDIGECGKTSDGVESQSSQSEVEEGS